MTEDEAKTKWCPFAFTFGALFVPQAEGSPDARQYGPQNRGYQMHGSLPGCMCIASACMAWRTVREAFTEDSPTVSNQSPGEGWYWSAERKVWWHSIWIENGYCGLAGATT